VLVRRRMERNKGCEVVRRRIEWKEGERKEGDAVRRGSERQ
jgi:hypothetical protein